MTITLRRTERSIQLEEPGDSRKYLNVILCRDDGHYTRSIHRLVAEHFVDGYFDGAVPNHIDGNNRNNVSNNLEWVSVKENVHKSYRTSGIGAKRNFKRWDLYGPDHTLLGTFYSHNDMTDFIKEKGLSTSPSMLVKYGKHNGYYVNKRKCNPRLETVTTIRKEYMAGETPAMEAPVPVYTGEDIV